MHIRVTISAVIGANRQSMAISASLNDQGEFRMDFPKDLDWAHSIYLILEPDDATVYKDRYLRGKARVHAENYGGQDDASTYVKPDMNSWPLAPDCCPTCNWIAGQHDDNCASLVVPLKEKT